MNDMMVARGSLIRALSNTTLLLHRSSHSVTESNITLKSLHFIKIDQKDYTSILRLHDPFGWLDVLDVFSLGFPFALLLIYSSNSSPLCTVNSPCDEASTSLPILWPGNTNSEETP